MRRRRILVALAVPALLLSACGGDDDGDTAADVSGTSAPEESEAPETAPVLELADSPLGEILVDAEGRTVYLFTKDESGASSCVDACAETWPPVEAPAEATVGEGLDEGLVGTIERDDGSSQLTYGGSPLYRYTPDRSPGDTSGQGVGGVWFVVAADGEAVTSEAQAANASY